MTDNVNPAENNGNNSETVEQNTAPESIENTSTEATAQEQQAPGDASNASETPVAEASATTPAESADTPSTPEASAPAETAAPASTPEASAPAETAAPASTPEASAPAETTATASTPEASAPAETAATASTPEAPAPAETAATVSTPEAPAASGDATAQADPAPEPEPEPEPKISLEEMRKIWDELTAKKDSRDAIEVTVTGVNRGGVITVYNEVEIFVPLSHWSIDRSVDMPDAQQGETFPVFILEISHFDTDARRVTGTRRSILRKALIESLEIGQRLQGRISSITDFGAFVDIGGVDGLLHVSEMSYARNKQPHELVKKGQGVEVVIKSIEKGGKRISLGHKELFDSPWTGVATKFPPDSIQKGKVVSLTDLGAFVELEPGVDGLIRPRELSWTQRIGSASEVLSVGQEIDVMVLNVNEDQERMSLSLKRAQENPWPQIVERFSGDGTWEGEVKELSNKGAVISVDGVEGFLPRGRMGRDASKLTEMKAGDKLEVRVVEIDPKRPSVIFGTPMDSGGGYGGGHSDDEDGERGRRGGGRGGERGGRGGGRGGERDGRGGGGRRGGGRDRGPVMKMAPPLNELKNATNVSNFSLGDMLGDTLREKLGLEPEPEPTPEPKAEAAPVTATPEAPTVETTEAAAATTPAPEPKVEAAPAAETATPEAPTAEETAASASTESTEAAPTEETPAPAVESAESSTEEAPNTDAAPEATASEAPANDASSEEEKNEG